MDGSVNVHVWSQRIEIPLCSSPCLGLLEGPAEHKYGRGEELPEISDLPRAIAIRSAVKTHEIDLVRVGNELRPQY